MLAKHETSTGAWPIWVIPNTDFSLYVAPTVKMKERESKLFSVTGIDGEHRVPVMTRLVREAGLNNLSAPTYYARASNIDLYITHDDIFLTPKKMGNQHLRRDK